MNCQQFFNILEKEPVLFKDQGEVISKELAVHLKQCSKCREEVAFRQAIQDIVTNPVNINVSFPNVEFAEKVLAKIEASVLPGKGQRLHNKNFLWQILEGAKKLSFNAERLIIAASFSLIFAVGFFCLTISSNEQFLRESLSYTRENKSSPINLVQAKRLRDMGLLPEYEKFWKQHERRTDESWKQEDSIKKQLVTSCFLSV